MLHQRLERQRDGCTMANPTSAFLSAGPSFVPSPVTATTSRLACSLLSMMPFTRMYLSVGELLASTRSRGHTLSRRCCWTCRRQDARSLCGL
ncbi:hypothetical protein AVEN_117662-1 [Araneus ventricosus]|uniref:Uncharacterized protein n=1 Tax=Araneus ventricosus TaxID=182803 RepID=A0A4Y2H356_ARAVE|nr:hypothetical protein AVEN_117662-1 [Araneus ventricosus]